MWHFTRNLDRRFIWVAPIRYWPTVSHYTSLRCTEHLLGYWTATAKGRKEKVNEEEREREREREREGSRTKMKQNKFIYWVAVTIQVQYKQLYRAIKRHTQSKETNISIKAGRKTQANRNVKTRAPPTSLKVISSRAFTSLERSCAHVLHSIILLSAHYPLWEKSLRISLAWTKLLHSYFSASASTLWHGSTMCVTI